MLFNKVGWSGGEHGPSDALGGDLAAVVDLRMDGLADVYSWRVHSTLCVSMDHLTMLYVCICVCLPH